MKFLGEYSPLLWGDVGRAIWVCPMKTFDEGIHTGTGVVCRSQLTSRILFYRLSLFLLLLHWEKRARYRSTQEVET